MKVLKVKGAKSMRMGKVAASFSARSLALLLTGVAFSFASLPALAKAPESSPRPVWRAGNPTAALSPAPTPPAADAKRVDPALPQDPSPEQMAALYFPGRHAPGSAPQPHERGAAEGGAARPAGPEVSSSAIRPIAGPVLDPAARAALDHAPRPKWRPLRQSAEPSPVLEATSLAVSSLAMAVSPRPKFRPKGLGKAIASSRQAKVEQASLRIAPIDPGPKLEPKASKGGLCGIAGLTGAKLTPIAAGGCGIQDPVRLTAVSGIALSAPATMDCSAARALSSWVDRTLLPTVGKTGGGVKRIDVAASYACRPRNNQKGQKLSEHGRGKAIDITAIQLKNGASLSVLKGWNDRSAGPLLKALHRGACGPFGTVLGPNANAFHRDHFHFDTASYRNGAYCK